MHRTMHAAELPSGDKLAHVDDNDYSQFKLHKDFLMVMLVKISIVG